MPGSTISTGSASGADVRLAGVKVGSVNEERIDPKNFLAVVALSVRNDIKLPKDSAAIVTSESLLGGKYLSLQPGGDETMLQPGETITITQSSVSLEELLGKFIFSIDQRAEGWRRTAGNRSAESHDPAAPVDLAATRRRAGVLPREAAHAGGEPRRTGARRCRMRSRTPC